MKKMYRQFWSDVEKLAIEAVKTAWIEYVKAMDKPHDLHDWCMHDGDERCAYDVLWKAMQSVDPAEHDYQDRIRLRELEDKYKEGLEEGRKLKANDEWMADWAREPDGVEFD